MLSRDTANKGNPFLRTGEGVRCRSPRRANSDTTLPTETFRSLASERAVSRISSSIFRVVLTSDTLIWIDLVKLPLRLSKSPPAMCSIQGAAGMIHDGGSL